MTGYDFVLDTNVVIYLQKGLLAAPLPAGCFAISVVTEIELRGFAGLNAEQDAGFPNDVVKTNTVQILRQAGIDDVKSL
ncbi:MAG: hypothetical protein WCA32_01480 [Chromatiaceae bacterium]|jgi:predicted nucleic acid-binding protein